MSKELLGEVEVKLREVLRFFEDMVSTERYASKESIIHNLDPRTKLLLALMIIVTAVAVRNLTSLLLLFLVLMMLVIISRISVRYFILRATVFIPIFAGVIALPLLFLVPGVPLGVINLENYTLTITEGGVQMATTFVLKVWICVASMIFLILTTRFSKIVRALDKLRAPKVFTMMLAMTYRYLFLFVEEAYRMALAKEARSVREENRTRILKSIGNILGALFIRAYEKGEQVYMAMLARGYTGEAKSLGGMKSRINDWLFGANTIFLCVVVLLTDLFLGGIAL